MLQSKLVIDDLHSDQLTCVLFLNGDEGHLHWKIKYNLLGFFSHLLIIYTFVFDIIMMCFPNIPRRVFIPIAAYYNETIK